jgi:hypothetical protein
MTIGPQEISDLMNIETGEGSPFDELAYLALRAAFVSTLNSLLRHALDSSENDDQHSGFLDRIPIMSAMAPQIQMECLLNTWERIKSDSDAELLPIDECVLHASFEELAGVSLLDDRSVLRQIWMGPKLPVTRPDCWLYSKVRTCQVARTTTTNVPLSTSSSMAGSDELHQLLHSFTERPLNSPDLLDFVGRWRASRETLLNSSGLLNENEQDMIRAFFEEHPQLLSEG